MKHTMTIMPSGQTFDVNENETVLDAAIRQAVPIAYTCRSGTCRTCLFQVVEGIVEQEYPQYCMITEQEIADGRRLLCMSTCGSDAVIAKPERRRKPVPAEEGA
jgi:ferredoxin